MVFIALGALHSFRHPRGFWVVSPQIGAGDDSMPSVVAGNCLSDRLKSSWCLRSGPNVFITFASLNLLCDEQLPLTELLAYASTSVFISSSNTRAV